MKKFIYVVFFLQTLLLTSQNTFSQQTNLKVLALGAHSTRTGTGALVSETTGDYNSAFGYGALNAATSGYNNSGIGYGALNAITTGHNNTAVGYGALSTVVTAVYNTAVGSVALQNNTGSYNTGVGYQALMTNTSGYQNTASGYRSLYLNTTGNYNTAYGNESLWNNTTGVNNTAIGSGSLGANTTGYENTALGYSASNPITSGYQNTSIGTGALGLTTTGYENLALGFRSLWSNTTGYQNVGIGNTSLYNNTTGYGNTALGYGADVNGGNYTNATSIGYNSFAISSNSMHFGNTNVTDWGFGTDPSAGRCLQVGTTSSNGNGAYLTDGGTWTNASDKNLKEDFQVQNPNEILKRVNALDITRWKYKNTTNEYHIGPMAQDFYKLFNVGLDDKSISTIDPSGVALLAIQALSAINNEQEKSIQDLQEQIDELKKVISNQQAVSISPLGAGATISQNIPNPFNGSTSISYYLPSNKGNAFINFYTNSGQLLKSVKLSGIGNGSIQLSMSEMPSGAYQYSLMIDGKQVGTKQMLLAK